MNDSIQEFIKRMKRFPNVQLRPSSYPVQSRSGSKAWVARVYIWDDHREGSVVTPIWSTPKTLYRSQDEANAVALVDALVWLEAGRPELPPLASQ